MISFDTEDDQKGNVSLVCFFDGIHFFDFYGPTVREQSIRFIEDHPSEIFWAHNLEYDLCNVFEIGKSPITHHYTGSRLIFADWEMRRFFDTMNLSNPHLSIAKMGDQIGLPKLDPPPFDGRVTLELIDYCRCDCEIAFCWIQMMEKKLSAFGARLLPTLPAIALDYFKDHCYPLELPRSAPFRPLLYRAYAGGRTELFRLGPVEAKGQVHSCDFQSMYPSVMRSEIYPSPWSGYPSNKLELEREGVVDVTLWLPEMNIPPLWS